MSIIDKEQKTSSVWHAKQLLFTLVVFKIPVRLLCWHQVSAWIDNQVLTFRNNRSVIGWLYFTNVVAVLMNMQCEIITKILSTYTISLQKGRNKSLGMCEHLPGGQDNILCIFAEVLVTTSTRNTSVSLPAYLNGAVPARKASCSR